MITQLNKILILMPYLGMLLAASNCSPSSDVSASVPDFPHVLLSNGLIDMPVFLPDKEKGFYRSTRFEWSGMPWQLTYEGHTYFRQRIIPHDPTVNENAMSLAEEFSISTNKEIPLRYAEAEAGETFVKIGCGVLRKPEGDTSYFFTTDYELVDPGEWTTEHGPNWVQFTHRLKDTHGYGYEYTKRMELVPDKPELLIQSSLRNTGTRPILQDHYNHNFFHIDGDSIGADYRVDFAFAPQVENKRGLPPAIASLEGKQLIYHQAVERSVFMKCQGYSDDPSDGTVTITNIRTGAGVTISGDFPLYGLNYWSDKLTLCPELFVKIELAPGENQQWSRRYRFFVE